MAAWYWYLLATALLSFAGYLAPRPGPVAALALAVHAAFQAFPPKRRAVAAPAAALAGAAAAALLWRESFLPPVSTLFAFLADPKTRPTAGYLLEFAWQSVDLRMLAAAAALLAATAAAHRRAPLLLGLAAYALFGAACLLGPKAGSLDLDGGRDPARIDAPAAAPAPNIAGRDPFYLRRAEVPGPAAGAAAPPAVRSPAEFYRREGARTVVIPRPAEADPPFDVLILHVCSLSWKDLKDAGADLKPFLAKFDYVFTDFSAACSYSGPASLRVLRSPCGQEPHRRLYFDAPPGCYLLDGLRAGGFKTYTMFSHDGKFDDFAANAQKHGHADPPLGVEGLPPAYQMFNGAPMFRDDTAFHRFWAARQDSAAPRAALYYNTANLHVGTHRPGVPKGPDARADYKGRLDALVAQLEHAMAEVERSGRNAVVVFVPEHGAALTGNKMQAQDVRDIPLPPIAVVPAGVRLIGKRFRADAPKPTVITKPASLQALAWLIGEFLRHDPFGPDARDAEAVAAEVPVTDFLAEDENAAVMRLDEGYAYRLKDGDWKPLPDFALIPPATIPSAEELRRAGAKRDPQVP